MNKLNFKYLFPNLFLFCICMNLTACSEKNSGGDNLQSGDEIISFEPDLNTLIRNPASGWTLYDDANDYVAQANTYWNQQGAAAENMLLFFIGVPDGLSSNQKKVNTHGNMTRISKRSFKAPLTED